MGRTEAHEGLQAEDHPAKPREKRSGKLVIVESPAKARTVGRFLGKGYTVKASVGHVRDLLRSQLSVDVEHDFTPKYRVPNEKRAVVKELKDLAKKAEEIYLATDPDREGEAIAWHLLEATDLEPQLTQRVVFHEITEPAIAEAFAHPREINMDLVDAQQARRVLDRLVGYNLSPLLWRKVRGRLSAGRVQSVALRLVVEREREIDAFNPVEYWSMAAELLPQGGKDTFLAKLVKVDGEEPAVGQRGGCHAAAGGYGKGGVPDQQDQAAASAAAIPLAPFITSTLQQEASPQAGLHCPAHHGAGAAALRRHRSRRRRRGRPDHLHAHRLDQRLRAGAERSAPVHRRALWRQVPAGRAAQVQDQSPGRAGSARSHPPHFRDAPAGRHQGVPDRRPVPALPAHLAALRRLPDVCRAVRHPDGRDRLADAAARIPAAGFRIDGALPGLLDRLRRSQG